MSDDERIARILGEWKDRRDRGERVDPAETARAHPDLADQLRAKVEDLTKEEQARDGGGPDVTRLLTLSPDRYADFRPVGEGGMGIVYWAIDTSLNREVAFKVIRPEGAEGEEATPAAPAELCTPAKDTPASRAFETLKQRFLQEAWVTGGMAHPGIVPVYELGQTPEGVPYYTMRFVKGERTLAHAIEETEGKDIEERLTLLEPFLKVCDTLRYAHSRGVIHRDLKPDNVALGEYGEVVLLDWGLAKLKGTADVQDDRLRAHVQTYREATDLKTIAGALGTPGYMSPEAALGRSEAMDERSDVYSLGAILFEILTGRPPIELTTFAEFATKLLKEDPPRAVDVDSHVPTDLGVLCHRCMARDMDARPASVQVITQAIRTWQQESDARREMRALLRNADVAMEATAGLGGQPLLQQLDRVTTLARRVLLLREGHKRARGMLRTCEKIRTRALRDLQDDVRAAERAERVQLVRRVAVGALAVLLVGVGIALWMLDRRRQEAEDAKARTAQALLRTEEERNAKAKALAQAEAERDAKNEALAEVEAERDARQEALARVEQERDANAKLLERVRAERDAKTEALAKYESERRAKTEAEAAVGREREAKLEESRRTRALALVNASAAAEAEDRMRSLLLAREAMGLMALPEVLTRLHEALCASRARHELRGHVGPVVSATLSPDGTYVLTAGRDGTARLWRSADGEPVVTCQGPPGALTGAVFSPDGKLFLTASENGTARVWSLDGQERAVCTGHEGPVVSAVFSRSGNNVLTASADGTARLFHASGSLRYACQGHKGPLAGASLAPQSSAILTYGADRKARLHGARGKVKETFGRHEGALVAAAFSPDGEHVLTASTDGTARLWDTEGKHLRLVHSQPGALTAAAFSPRGDRILLASSDGTAGLWDLQGTPVVQLEGQLPGLVRVRFTSDGDRILATSSDESAVLWDSRGKRLAVFRGHTAAVLDADLHAATDLLVTASADGTARVWSARPAEIASWRCPAGEGTATAAGPDDGEGRAAEYVVRGQPIATFEHPEGAVREAFVVEGEDRIVTIASWTMAGLPRDVDVRVWDAQGSVQSVFPRPKGSESRLLVSPRGRLVLATVPLPGERTGYDLWSVTGRKLDSITEQMLPAFLPTEDRLITFPSTSLDEEGGPPWFTSGRAILWNARGRKIDSLKVPLGIGEDSRVFCSPDGTRFLLATDEAFAGEPSLYDLEGRLIRTFADLHVERLRKLQFTPDGAQVLGVESAADGRTLVLRWTVESGDSEQCDSWRGAYSDAALSPDGTLVLVGKGDEASLFEATPGRLRRRTTLAGHAKGVTAVAFHPEREWLATGSEDHTARVWSREGRQLAELRGHTGPVRDLSWTSSGDRLLTRSDDGTARLWQLERARALPVSGSVPLGLVAALSGARDLIVTSWNSTSAEVRDLHGNLEARLEGHRTPIRYIVVGHRTRMVATISADDEVRIWDLGGKPLRTYRTLEGPIRAVALGPRDRNLLVRGTDSVSRLDLADEKLRSVAVEGVLSAAFSPKGDRILVTSADGAARLLDLEGDPRLAFASQSGPVALGTIAPSGRAVAAAVEDEVVLWGLDGLPRAILPGHGARITKIVFAPDGSLVLAAYADGTARLWDVRGTEITVLRGHDGDVLDVAFSPSGDRIVTASKDRTARLWSSRGEALGTLRGHEGWVTTAAFVDAGAAVLTVSQDGSVRLWTASMDDLAALADKRILRDFTPEERLRYQEILTDSTDR